MKIGVSVPWSFLAGMSTDAGTEALNSQIADKKKFLKKLKNEGVYSIELRHWQDELVSATDTVFNLIIDTGLRVTVHGDIDENGDNQKITESFPWLESCIRNIPFSDYQKLVIALHPIKNKTKSIEENYEKSISILRQLNSEIQSNNLPITLAYENQREKGYPDPGIYYEQLVSAVKDLNSLHIGICWDMGHAYSNFKRNLLVDNPPDCFLSGVVHTHIHDLHPVSNATHWPLTCSTIPLERYIGFLKSVNYYGIFNLELSPNKFQSDNIVQSFVESIKILKASTDRHYFDYQEIV